MTTHDLPTVDVSLSRSARPPALDAAASSATTASAPIPKYQVRRRRFRTFRFSAADVAVTAAEIEADLGYGRD